MTKHATDHELMQRFGRGDAVAFEELVRRWYSPLGGLLARLAPGPAAAHAVDDLRQEVFLRVVRAREQYRTEGAFSTWLYRIALNVARDNRRRGARSAVVEAVDTARPSTDAGPVDAASTAERGAAVSEALAALPDELREVLVLKHYGRLSFSEVAKVTGLATSTVKSRAYLALTRMRRELRNRGIGPEELE